MVFQPDGREQAREQVIAWARDIIGQPFRVFDTETTGFNKSGPPQQRIVQLGIVDQDGQPLLDTLVRPSVPIEYGAQRVHGISMDRVADAPDIPALYEAIKTALDGQIVLAYNLDFDTPMLTNALAHAGLPALQFDPQSACVMKKFARYYGEPSRYRGSFKWQKLHIAVRHFGLEAKFGFHSAVDDCLATLAVMRGMADGS